MIRQLVIATLLFLTVGAHAEAASVRAVVDRNQATIGESIALQVTIDGGEGELDLSGITAFKVLSRGTSSSFQMINGRTSRQITHNYALIALKAGNLTIPAIPVTIGAKVHLTIPIRVTVASQPPTDSGKRDVYVTAEISEATPWIGQQVLYIFRLYNAVQIADAKFQAPQFMGFNAEELEDRQSHRTVVNGREFIVTEVRFILVPIKVGDVKIEPAVLQVSLLQRSRRPQPFSGMDSFFGRTEMTTRVLETDPITMQVKSLPPTSPGSTFSGLVGTFDLSASLEKTKIRVGDSTTLAVTISGSGNIMDAVVPPISAPTQFKTYTDNPEEIIQKDTQGFSGSKTFRTALVPVQTGQYRIEPIVLTYFDVGSGRYRTIDSAPFEIDVATSETATTDINVFRAAAVTPPSLKTRVEFTGRDILPLKESLDTIEPRPTLSPIWFGLFLALPALGFGLVTARVQMTQKDDSPHRIMAERTKKALKTAASADSSDADFLSALYRALVSAILGSQGAVGTSLTWSDAKSQLVDLGWEADDADATAQLLETIESFNYSGSRLDNQTRTDLLERTRQAIRRLAR